MRGLIGLTKALADEGRLRIVGALLGGELCVCQIIELLELAPSTVSKHLALLRQAGLLDVRKDGRWAYYRLAGPDASRAVKRAIELVATGLDEEGQGARDGARLEEILRIDPEMLCCQQREQPIVERRRERRLVSSSSARGTRRGAR